MNLKKIIARVTARLNADAKLRFIALADGIAERYHLKPKPKFYPKEYEAKVDATAFPKVVKAFEAIGLKFHKLAASSPKASAVRAEGLYEGVDYLVDVIQHGPYLTVDVYF